MEFNNNNMKLCRPAHVRTPDNRMSKEHHSVDCGETTYETQCVLRDHTRHKTTHDGEDDSMLYSNGFAVISTAPDVESSSVGGSGAIDRDKRRASLSRGSSTTSLRSWMKRPQDAT